MEKDEAVEELGQAIDRVDSLACGLAMPLPADMHVANLKTLLPKIVEQLKAAYVGVVGANPWD